MLFIMPAIVRDYKLQPNFNGVFWAHGWRMPQNTLGVDSWGLLVASCQLSLRVVAFFWFEVGSYTPSCNGIGLLANMPGQVKETTVRDS